MVLPLRPVVETSESDPDTSGHSLPRHQLLVLLLCLCLATGLLLFLGHMPEAKPNETAIIDILNEPAETELLWTDSAEDDVTAGPYLLNNEEIRVENSVALGSNTESFGSGLSHIGRPTQPASIISEKSCPAPATSSKAEREYESEGVNMATLFVAGVLTKLMGNFLSRHQILWVSAI